MRNILSSIFSYSLVIYLIFFLLETMFPGFVTNNFSLNYFLIPVLIFGAMSVAFPPIEEEKVIEKPASKLDLVLIIALSIGSSFLIFYKFSIDNLVLKLVVSIISGLLTLLLGTMLIYFPDEAGVEEDSEEMEIKNLLPSKQLNPRWQKVAPVFAVAVLIIALIVFIPKFMIELKNAPVAGPTPNPVVTLAKADPKIKVIVYNAGAESGEAARYSEIFKKKGYIDATAANYPVTTIENTLIQFKESDSAQADLIESILKNDYTTVNRWPLASTSAEIRVILGAKPLSEPNSADFGNENVDFFFQ